MKITTLSFGYRTPTLSGIKVFGIQLVTVMKTGAKRHKMCTPKFKAHEGRLQCLLGISFVFIQGFMREIAEFVGVELGGGGEGTVLYYINYTV